MQASNRLRCLAVSSFFICAFVAPDSIVTGGDLIDDVEGYHFILPTVLGTPGAPVSMEIQGLHEEGVQGFQLAVRYPSDQLTIDRIHGEETILDAIQTDFVDVTIDAEGGFFTVGVLVDTEPPFEGQVIPNIGRPLTLLHLEGRVSEDAEEDLTLRLENGLSNPPLSNILVVDNQSIPVDEMAEGIIDLPDPPPFPAFVRGDANSDGSLDISDAMHILDYRFLGGRRPACMNAADANDDEDVSMADAVFILGYLFQGAAAPSAPMPAAGVDPTPGELDCERPLEWIW
jgi:hypothetical protein